MKRQDGRARPRGSWPLLAIVGVGVALGIVFYLLTRQVDDDPREPSPPTVSEKPRTIEAPAATPEDPSREIPLTRADGREEVYEGATAPPTERERALVALRERIGGGPPVTLPDPVYHPRPASEWQGMLVDVAVQPFCDRVDGCGLAMACLGGQCGPCRSDAECAPGEMCVLDHCVLGRSVECRSAAECREDALCVLNGYSSDPRGNENMRSFCLGPGDGTGGLLEEAEPYEKLELPAEIEENSRETEPAPGARLRKALSEEEEGTSR